MNKNKLETNFQNSITRYYKAKTSNIDTNKVTDNFLLQLFTDILNILDIAFENNRISKNNINAVKTRNKRLLAARLINCKKINKQQDYNQNFIFKKVYDSEYK